MKMSGFDIVKVSEGGQEDGTYPNESKRAVTSRYYSANN